MNTATAAVLLIIIFALLSIAAFLVYPRIKTKITGPFNTGLEIKGERNDDEKEQPMSGGAAIRAKDIKSRSGGLVADDQTGRGLDVEQVEVEDDVLLSSRDAHAETPKDQPPA